MRQPLFVLLLGTALCAGVGARAAQMPQTPPSKVERAPAAPPAISPPLPIGVEADVYCAGWLDDEAAVFPATVISAELIDSKKGFIEGDVLYIDAGTNQGLAAGQEFWIVRPERRVYRWGSVTDVLGRIFLTPGRARIICAQENAAIAEIVLSCSDINIGDALLPFEPVPVPLVRRTAPSTSCDPETGKVNGHIADVQDAITPIHQNTVVFLDRGEEDGLVPGDFFTVFRIPIREKSVRIVLGEAAILMTRKKTSVAIITSMRDTMYVGDQVELK
jgi:hypothetical protein